MVWLWYLWFFQVGMGIWRYLIWRSHCVSQRQKHHTLNVCFGYHSIRYDYAFWSGHGKQSTCTDWELRICLSTYRIYPMIMTLSLVRHLCIKHMSTHIRSHRHSVSTAHIETWDWIKQHQKVTGLSRKSISVTHHPIRELREIEHRGQVLIIYSLYWYNWNCERAQQSAQTTQLIFRGKSVPK